jgi:arginyl-tRNA--protein-N-Asp/Glu arginylyltransferase
MESLFRYTVPVSQCGYLPQERWSLEYEYAALLSREEYLELMQDNWRRFGHMLFRPNCPTCRMCRALRVRAAEFRPDRSQRRTRAANEGAVERHIGPPSVTREKLDLYDRYHAHQAEFKGWPHHEPRDEDSYSSSFVDHPFAVEEWTYWLEGELIGVGYVDHLPVEPMELSGLSAIYFFYDPKHRDRSLGTWNILCLIDEAARRGLPYVYLGYYVAGCGSMEYKTRFVPNELRGADGVWREFRS